jgi:antitoxin (DNA-binding transcriptional repressor) of toxin-antitoxin stability system
MTLRIDVKDLGEEVCASLERGEAVEIERDGRVVAKIEPPKGGLLAFIEARKGQEPMDEDWERDMETARRMLNESVFTEPWE